MLLLFCFCFVWCQLSLCGAIFCMLSLLRSTTGLVAMPNRTCWDVYIIHPNNTNVSMLHLLFIFAFFIMLSLFLCIFLFSFRLVFVQTLYGSKWVGSTSLLPLSAILVAYPVFLVTYFFAYHPLSFKFNYYLQPFCVTLFQGLYVLISLYNSTQYSLFLLGYF